jgi:hypothetical protein
MNSNMMHTNMMHTNMMQKADISKKTDRIIKTGLSIDIIKQRINKILHKERDMCKYWENINEPIWGVSFKVDESQYQAMLDTAFEISVKFDLSDEMNHIRFSEEIEGCDQWSFLYNKFIEGLY